MARAGIITGTGAPTLAAGEGSGYQREDPANGDIYVMHNGVWTRLLRESIGTVAVTMLALGPTNTVLWSNGTTNQWSGAPIVSTSLQVGTGSATSLFQTIVGGTDPALYLGGVTPSASNYSMKLGTASQLILSTNGAGITFAKAGLGVLIAQTNAGSNNLQFFGSSGAAAPSVPSLISVGGLTIDTPTTDLTIRTQIPFSGAATNVTAGNLVFDIPAPTSGTTHSNYKFKISSIEMARIGYHPNFGLLASTAVAGLWMGNGAQTPTSTNHALFVVADSAVATSTLQLNVAYGVGTGSVTTAFGSLDVAGAHTMLWRNDRLQMATGQAALIEHQQRAGDNQAFDFTISPQAPSSSATTVLNKTPGNLIINVPAPISGGGVGYVRIRDHGVNQVQFGATLTFPTFGTAWFGNVDAAVDNWSISGDGNSFLSFAGKQNVTDFEFITNLVSNGGLGKVAVNLGRDGSGVYIGLGEHSATTADAARIVMQPRLSDTATTDLTFTAMAPFVSATGVRQNSGNFIFDIPAAVGAGTRGAFKVTHATSAAFSVDSTTQLTLFGLRTFTAGSGAPGGTPLEGQMYMRTGPAGTGDLLVGVNGVWVSTTAGASGIVPSSRQVIAGAGMTGGGTLASDVTLDVVAADGTIVVAADSIRVGTIAVTNIAVGAANTVLWSNGSANSFTGSPILSTSLSIGTTPATVGLLRLANNDGVFGRNAANSVNLTLVATDTSDRVVVGTSAASVRMPIYGVGVAHFDASGIISSTTILNADIANATITTGKLSPGTNGQVIMTNGTPVAVWQSYAGDVTGTPAASTVVGLTGVANVTTQHGTTITTANTEQIFEQTGDALGSSRIRIRNRSAMSGLVIENSALDLVDIRMIGSSTAVSNLRLEGRGGQMRTGSVEWQIGIPGAPTLAAGSSNNLLWLSNTTDPSATPSAGGYVYEKSGGLYHKGSSQLTTTLGATGSSPLTTPTFKDTRIGSVVTNAGGTNSAQILTIDFAADYAGASSGRWQWFIRYTVIKMDTATHLTYTYCRMASGNLASGGQPQQDGTASDIFNANGCTSAPANETITASPIGGPGSTLWALTVGDTVADCKWFCDAEIFLAQI